MEDAAVQMVRSFNRVVGQRIGALDDRFLGRARPMGESRTLWEIGSESADVRELRATLALDSGYLSRVLRALEAQGLVRVKVSPDDRRVRRVHLTKAGRRERLELDRRSKEVATSFLEPLTEAQRTRLVAAMADVERLLRVSMVEFAPEEPGTADAQWCLDQYFAELNRRFDDGFNPAISISADTQELRPPAGLLLLARIGGRPVGCGALKFHRGEAAELKRMWLATESRGLGIGRRLLHELERHARDAGANVIRLETNRALVEAIALYRHSGYRDVDPFNNEPYAHHWFEKRLDASTVVSG